MLVEFYFSGWFQKMDAGHNLRPWRFVALSFWLFLGGVGSATGNETSEARAQTVFPVDLRSKFAKAISDEKPSFHIPSDVSGITVPHHVVAADLIARGFWAASNGKYKRVILLSPDHFRTAEDKAIVFSGSIETVFGRLHSDPEAIKSLQENTGVAIQLEKRKRLLREHGLLALMPFVANFFPEAKVVPIAIGISTRPSQWEELSDALLPLLGPETLLVQSTDFSHYLSLGNAITRDQETLNVIASAETEAIQALDQPGHLDSRAAMAIQMDLLVNKLGHHQTVVANRNLVDYSPTSDERTTSYITIVFTRAAESTKSLRYADQKTLYFAGDVFLGRYLTSYLIGSVTSQALKDKLAALISDVDLIANLEGAVLSDDVIGLPSNLHHMRADLVRPILQAMNINALSLANNHSRDLGSLGYNITKSFLEEEKIKILTHGQISDLGPVRVLSANHVRGKGDDLEHVYGETIPEEVCFVEAQPPVIVFAHLGREYTFEFDAKSRAIANHYAECGFQLVVGAHSHQASRKLTLLNGKKSLAAFSLGNLIFDQSGERASGAILEVRIFSRGTLSARLMPIPNLYDELIRLKHKKH